MSFKHLSLCFLSTMIPTLAVGQPAPLQKRAMDQFLAPAAQQIESHLGEFKADKTTKATQYYTPLFQPGPDGKLRAEDRRDCLNMEGSCLVGNYLYNYPGPNGIERSTIIYKFGKGNGTTPFNVTNALDPCRTLAADQQRYPAGTIIFIPAMKDKICPQSGKPVDGAFIVGDVGAAIKGQGRFDIFTGECILYSKRTNSCIDPANPKFGVAPGSAFYVVPRDNPLAKRLREEADAFIRRDWKTQG